MTLSSYPIVAHDESIRVEANIRDSAESARDTINNLSCLASAAGLPNSSLVAGFVTAANVSFSENGTILNPFYFPVGLGSGTIEVYLKNSDFDWIDYGSLFLFDEDSGELAAELDYSEVVEIGNDSFTIFSLYFPEEDKNARSSLYSLRWTSYGGPLPPARPLHLWLVVSFYSQDGLYPRTKLGAEGGSFTALPGDITTNEGDVGNISAARVYCIKHDVELHDKQARLMWFSTAPTGRGCAHKSYSTKWIPVFDDCVFWHALTGPSLTRYTLQIGEGCTVCNVGVNKIKLTKEKLGGGINIGGVDYYPVRIVDLNSGSTSVTAVHSETAWISKV